MSVPIRAAPVAAPPPLPLSVRSDPPPLWRVESTALELQAPTVQWGVVFLKTPRPREDTWRQIPQGW